MHTPLRHWIQTYQITPAERRQLYEGARLTGNALSQYVNGHRQISPATATRLERASLRLARVLAGAVPPLTRGELSGLCHACPYYQDVAHPAREGCAR